MRLCLGRPAAAESLATQPNHNLQSINNDSRPRSRASSLPWLPQSSPSSSSSPVPLSPSAASSPAPAAPAYHRWWRDRRQPHPLKAIERARRRASFLLLTVSLAVLGCLGWRCLYTASSGGKSGALNGSWRHGRYHDHATGLGPDASAYR